jgi:hypothetical protein
MRPLCDPASRRPGSCSGAGCPTRGTRTLATAPLGDPGAGASPVGDFEMSPTVGPTPRVGSEGVGLGAGGELAGGADGASVTGSARFTASCTGGWTGGSGGGSGFVSTGGGGGVSFGTGGGGGGASLRTVRAGGGTQRGSSRGSRRRGLDHSMGRTRVDQGKIAPSRLADSAGQTEVDQRRQPQCHAQESTTHAPARRRAPRRVSRSRIPPGPVDGSGLRERRYAGEKEGRVLGGRRRLCQAAKRRSAWAFSEPGQHRPRVCPGS